MATVLPFVIIGLAAGSIYGLAGIGLVLTYRISGIFNFAYGSLATIAAFVYYALNVQLGLAWPLAALIALVGVTLVVGYAMHLLGEVLSELPLAMQVAATIGILIAVEGGFTLLYGSIPLTFPQYLPITSVTIAGVAVGVNQIIVFLLGGIATLALYRFLADTAPGLRMRAVVQNPDLLALCGSSPTKVRRSAWMIGCLCAALAGLLLGPTVNLDATTVTLLIMQAFGAAAIGRFESLPWTYLGGLLIGVIASVATKYATGANTLLLGLPSSVPFIVLFVILLFAPRSWRTRWS
jgi:branched-subunit amino acid ABC-type transport system permease component